jgi:fimbrial isopeptide formation D2 family protein
MERSEIRGLGLRSLVIAGSASDEVKTIWQIGRAVMARMRPGYLLCALRATRHGRRAPGKTALAAAAIFLLSLSAAQALTGPAMTISESQNPSIFGQSVTFTVTVSFTTGTGTPTGTVTISFVDNTTGATGTLGASMVNPGPGTGEAQAILSSSALLAGNLTITSTYSGDNNFSGNSLTTPYTVQKRGAGTNIGSSTGNTATLGQSVTFTSDVTPVIAGTGPPTGTVTFTVNGNTVATQTLNGNAQATFTTSSLPLRSDTVTATYNGDNNFNGGTGGILVLTVSAPSPPSITKTFGASSINVGQSTTLSFTINNPNAPVSLTGVGFTDNFPAGLVVATPSVVTGSCGGGTITATAGNSSASLSGATLAPGAVCTFSVNVTAATTGTKTNITQPVTSNEGGTGNTATASITVNAPSPPQISKQFGATSINTGQSTSLSFTITNPNASSSLTGVGFTDTLPTGLVVATPNGLSGTCNGTTPTATAGSGSVVLSGATLAANASCTFSVNVAAKTAGAQNNVTSAVTSNEGGNGNTANASIGVNAPSPPQISKLFGAPSINIGQTTSLSFTISNPNATSSLTGIGFTDPLPSGLVVATPGGLSGTCNGTTTTGTASVTLSGRNARRRY